MDTWRNNNIDADVIAVADNVISFKNGLSLNNDYSFSSSILSSGHPTLSCSAFLTTFSEMSTVELSDGADINQRIKVDVK